MKKVFLSLVVLAALMSSCKKYELSEEYSIDKLPKVKVTGIVTIPTESGKMLFAPEGKTIYFSVPKDVYNLDNHYGKDPEGKYITSATIQKDGKYEAYIPVPSYGVDVEITGEVFNANYKESDVVSYEKNYRLNSTSMFCHLNTPNQTKDLTYSGYSIPTENGEITPTKTVSLSGKIEYESAARIISSPYSFSYDVTPFPQGTKIKAEITLREYDSYYGPYYKTEKEITVGSDGKYSIDIPMIVNGYASVTLTAAKNLKYSVYVDGVNDESEKMYRFEIDEDIYLYEDANLTKNIVAVKGYFPLN